MFRASRSQPGPQSQARTRRPSRRAGGPQLSPDARSLPCADVCTACARTARPPSSLPLPLPPTHPPIPASPHARTHARTTPPVAPSDVFRPSPHTSPTAQMTSQNDSFVSNDPPINPNGACDVRATAPSQRHGDPHAAPSSSAIAPKRTEGQSRVD